MDYWSEIAEKIVVYDNGSTDNSLSLLSQYPKVEIRTFDSGNSIDESVYIELKDNCWKEQKGSDTDWVVVADMDELLWAKNLPKKLKRLTRCGYSIIVPMGVDMASETFPKYTQGVSIIDVCTKGKRNDRFNKCIAFDPNKIDQINYEVGAHTCQPTGDVKLYLSRDVLLLHFKNLSLDYIASKYAVSAKRLSKVNIENRWGFEYLWDQQTVKEAFETTLSGAVEVSMLSKEGIRTRLQRKMKLRKFNRRHKKVRFSSDSAFNLFMDVK